MTYTIEQVKKWVENFREELEKSFNKCETISDFHKKDMKLKETWCAGCWMNECLRENGASEQEITRIGFVLGQRSLLGDPYDWAVRYLNEYITTKRIKDQPGPELADEILGSSDNNNNTQYSYFATLVKNNFK